MFEKLADDRLRLAALAQPTLPHGPGLLFADVDFAPQFVQLLLPPRDLRLLLRAPFRECVAIGVELLTLLDETLLRLIDFEPLLDQGIPREPVILGEDLPGFLDPDLRDIGSGLLRQPAVGLFDGDAGLQRLAVGLLQFRAQLIEPVPPRLQILRVERHQILLPPEIGPRGIPFALERFAVLLQLLPVGGQPRFERPSRFDDQILLSVDRCRFLFDEVVPFIKMPPESANLILLFFQPDTCPLLFDAEFDLGSFEFFAGPVEMLLLKAQPVLQEDAFLTILGFKLVSLETERFPGGLKFVGGRLPVGLGGFAEGNQFGQQPFPLTSEFGFQLLPFGRQFETEHRFRPTPVLLFGRKTMPLPLQFLARDALLLLGGSQLGGLGEKLGLALIQFRQNSIPLGLKLGTKQPRPAVLLVEQRELLVQPLFAPLEFGGLKA